MSHRCFKLQCMGCDACMCFRPAGVKEVVCGRCGIAVYCSVKCLITHRDTHRSAMCDVVCSVLERKKVSVESLKSMVDHWQVIGNKDKNNNNNNNNNNEDKSTEDPEGSSKGSTASESEESKKRGRDDAIVVSQAEGSFFPIMLLPVNVLNIIFAYVTEGHGRNQSSSDVRGSSYVVIDPTTSLSLDLRLVAKKWKSAVEFHDWYNTLLINLDNVHARYLSDPVARYLLTLRDWLVRFNILDAFLPQSRNIRVLQKQGIDPLPTIEDRLQELGSHRGLSEESSKKARSLDCFLIWIAYSQSCENCVRMKRWAADYYKLLDKDGEIEVAGLKYAGSPRHLSVEVTHLADQFWFPPELATVRGVLSPNDKNLSLCDIARIQNGNPVFVPGLSVDSSLDHLVIHNCRNFSPIAILAGIGRAMFNAITVRDCQGWDEASWFYFGKMLSQTVYVDGEMMDVIQLGHFSQLENQNIHIHVANLKILAGSSPIGQTSTVSPGKRVINIEIENYRVEKSPKILPAPAFGHGMNDLAGMFEEHYGHHTLLWYGIAEALGNSGLGLELSDRSRRMTMSADIARAKVRDYFLMQPSPFIFFSIRSERVALLDVLRRSIESF